MQTTARLIIKALLLCLFCSVAWAEDNVKVPVLVYHRFGSSVNDGMTIRTAEFEQQLKWLKENNYTVIPLQSLIKYLRGEGPPPPAKSVVITADDGHKSVYTDMFPLIKKYNIPVTLFIYPSAISNASYAMTWDQLQQLQKTGQFDIQCHTYWHPNFKKDKKKMTPVEYQKDIDMQLNKSKLVLEKKMNTKIDALAWPFGIYDNELEQAAAKAGYSVAFSIDRHCASKSNAMMSQPRFMIVDGPGMKGFTAIMAQCHGG